MYMIFLRGNVMQTAITLNEVEIVVLKNSLVLVQVAMERSKSTLDIQMAVAKLLKKLDNQFNIQNPIIEE
jgi:hypothetical protein